MQALPYLVHRFYSRVLQKTGLVSCGEIKLPLSYDAQSGVLTNFKDIFSKFKVDRGDTLFLTMSNESTAIMRIYRMNGMEINYSNDGLDRNSLEDSWFYDDMMDISPFIGILQHMNIINVSRPSYIIYTESLFFFDSNIDLECLNINNHS